MVNEKMKIKKIKLIVLDIDGVLTDGKVVIDANNNEYKTLNYRDMDGITLLKKRGVSIALLTGDTTALADTIAKRLGVASIIKGAKEKARALKQLSEGTRVPLGNICYVGDADRDINALKLCGLGIVPQDTTKKAKESALVILKSKGGDGVVHEVIEYLIENGYLEWKQ